MSDNFNSLSARLSRRSVYFAVLVFAGAVWHAPVASAELKTAVVDTKELMNTLAVVSGMRDRLESEREKLTRQLKALAEKAENERDELEKNRINLSEIEIRRTTRKVARMQNEAQLMQRQFQEELDQREQEELLILRNELGSLVKSFIKKKKYDLIFFSDGLAGYKEGLDITEQLVKEIRSEYKSASKKK